MKTIILSLALSLNLAYAEKYLLMEPEVRNILPSSITQFIQEKSFRDGRKVIRTHNEIIDKIVHLVHHKFKKCGGFFSFDTYEDLLSFVEESRQAISFRERERFFEAGFPKTVEQDQNIQTLVDSVEEMKVREVIEHLSSYQNRYYTSSEGVKAAKWIANKWESLLSNRSDVSVELFRHRFSQPSVILKVEGQTKDAIVIGGHLDSISSSWWDMFQPNVAHAPGADDNASGIATITEVIRVLSTTNYKPKKTIFFMGYAGEEKGLLGSKDIARAFNQRDSEYSVKAAVQFDMTNFNGSSEDMYFITDHTNAELTDYLITLNETYVHASWGKTKCGYACSDHASWHSMGVPAAFPFEASFRDANSKIHSNKDLIRASGGTADHAVHFTKLATAFMFDYSAL